MKNIIFFLLLLTHSFIISQNDYGKITYRGELNYNLSEKFKEIKINDQKKNEALKSTLAKIIKTNKPVTYELEFFKNESLFTKKEKIEIDKKPNLTAALGAKGKFYFNKKTNQLLIKKYVYGEDFIISQNINNKDWKLINESKKINNIICYKATTKTKLENSKGVFYEDVTAWYTPSIPKSFGPKNYIGLPGIILEVSTKNFKYTATKISLSKKKITINKPTKGKKITKEEFDRLSVKYAKEMGF